MSLLINITIMMSRTPITIMWNKHLPCFDSTFEDQEFKVFTVFPDDLPYNYGSLTAIHTSFRPWIGRTQYTLDVPGLEFFSTTGEYKEETECRNPEGKWFRQIIPQGSQLTHFLDEIKKICIEDEIQKTCIEDNKDHPDYDYALQDDSLEGSLPGPPKVSILTW